MNRRTLFLALGAAVVGVFYLLDQGYSRLIEQPTSLLETQLAAAQRSLGDAKAEQISGRKLANRLEDYAERALPHDPALARAVYQKWLLELVERHRMESASVNAETPKAIEVRGRVNRRQRRVIGHTIRYGVRARTTLQRWTDFLHDFQRSAQLHKIVSFSLSPLSGGSALDLNLVVETLSLDATERADRLSDWTRVETPTSDRQAYQGLVNRNLFARGVSPELARIRLGAITRGRGGMDQAWFRVGTPPRTQIVSAGESLELSLHSVLVKQIEAEKVLISVNDFSGWLNLGETLGKLLGVESDPPPTAADGLPPATPDGTAEQPTAGPAATGPGDVGEPGNAEPVPTNPSPAAAIPADEGGTALQPPKPPA